MFALGSGREESSDEKIYFDGIVGVFFLFFLFLKKKKKSWIDFLAYWWKVEFLASWPLSRLYLELPADTSVKNP